MGAHRGHCGTSAGRTRWHDEHARIDGVLLVTGSALRRPPNSQLSSPHPPHAAPTISAAVTIRRITAAITKSMFHPAVALLPGVPLGDSLSKARASDEQGIS